jgi:hypothetical protein
MQYDEKVGRLSAICVTNEIMPILISEILDDQNAAQSFVKYAYAYAASQSLDSCKFVIAK